MEVVRQIETSPLQPLYFVAIWGWDHFWGVSVVPGERTAENVAAVVEDFKRRTSIATPEGPRDVPFQYRLASL